MPDISEYLSKFGIIKGIELGGYRLVDVTGIHTEISKGHYEYPITMKFRSSTQSAKVDSLIAQLSKQTAEDKVIYSSYGNPYECHFGTPQLSHIESDGTVVITSLGNSHRIYGGKHELAR